MTTKPAETPEESAPAVSKKRQVVATVASTSVTVALGLAATALIENLASRVRKSIAPESE
jgi:hypothetical protein